MQPRTTSPAAATARNGRPGVEGGKAPSKEKHDPPAGRVMSTVTRSLPLVAAFRRTVEGARKFPALASVLVSALRVHLFAQVAALFGGTGGRSS